MRSKSRSLTRLRGLRYDQRGDVSLLTVAALVVGAIIAGVIAVTMVSAIRLGGDLTTVFTRDTQMTQMAERLQQELTNTTAMEVENEHTFTVHDRPSERNAYYMAPAGAPDVCVSNTWDLVDEGFTRTLVNTREVHEADSCDSPVVSDTTWELTGFATDTHFAYENPYGRDLTYVDFVEAGPDASTNTRPDGLFNNEWDYPAPGFVSLVGTLNQPFGTTPVDVTAQTSLKQLRPGVVTSELGELGPPVIQRVDMGGDLFRAQFSAVVSIEDPRAVLEWSYRIAHNEGSTPTDYPSESEWSAWSDWSTMDYVDDTVLQGGKWQVQAHYRVTLGAEVAESESVTMTWVRPIEPIVAPSVSVDPWSSTRLVVNVTPVAACPAGTTMQARDRYNIDEGAWSSWRNDTTDPYQRSVIMDEGRLLTAQGSNRCVSPFTSGPWADSTEPYASRAMPITSRPTVTNVTGSISGSTTRAAGDIDGCPTWLTYEARGGGRLNTDTSTTYPAAYSGASAGRVTRTTPLVAEEGYRFRGGISARCVSPYTNGPAISVLAPSWVTRPVATPTLTDVTSRLASNNTLYVSGTIGGCAASTQPKSRPAGRENAETAYTVGGWANTSNGFVERSAVTGIREGERASAQLSAQCVGLYASSSVRTVTAPGWQVRPITSRWTISGWHSYVNGALVNGQGNAAADCPAWMTQQVRFAHAIDYSGWSHTGWLTQGQSNNNVWYNGPGMNEGARAVAGADTRCVTAYATGPTNWYDGGYTYRGIGTAPTANVWTSLSGGNVYVGANSFSGCPAGTYREWERAVRVNGGGHFNWTGFGQWGDGSYYITYINPGNSAQGFVQTRCRSDFVIGPTRGIYPNTVYRAIPAPSAPYGMWGCHSGGAPYYNFTAGWSWPSYADYFQTTLYARFYGVDYYGTSANVWSSSWSASVYGSAGFQGATIYARSVNGSGTSGNTVTWIYSGRYC